MDKNVKFIDIKVSVWRRYSVPEEEVTLFLEKNKSNLIDGEFLDLFLIEEFDAELIPVEENNNFPTIEIFNKNDSLLWDNTQLYDTLL